MLISVTDHEAELGKSELFLNTKKDRYVVTDESDTDNQSEEAENQHHDVEDKNENEPELQIEDKNMVINEVQDDFNVNDDGEIFCYTTTLLVD